jgi:hypothetical protein
LTACDGNSDRHARTPKPMRSKSGMALGTSHRWRPRRVVRFPSSRYGAGPRRTSGVTRSLETADRCGANRYRVAP